MKSLKCGLTESTSLTYDKTKTTMAGRVRSRTLSGKSVVAPPLVTFADVNTVYGVAPGHSVINPSTGRKFELQNATTNTPTVLAFNFDTITGDWTFIGKVILTLPPGSHTYRGFDFDDTDANNVKILLSSTVTTSLCNGGTFYTWGLTMADFTISGTTLYMANATNQKAVYFAQYAGQPGLLHAGTVSGGVQSGRVFNTLANKPRFYQQNGASATLSIYAWDLSLGNPSVDGTVANGINCQTSAYAGTSPSAYFRLGASQSGYSTTANTAGAFEAVILQNGSGTTPSNFAVSLTTQTPYFMRDLQLVGGVWYFNLATTSTGAAVVPATGTTGFTMMRANGISTTHSLYKTGLITPSLTGTVLQANSFGTVVPTNVPAAPVLNGTDCLAIGTNSSLYLGKVSDLSDGVTTWATLSGVNLLGTGVDIVAPTATFAFYSASLDQWIYSTNTAKFITKTHTNNSISRVFGSLSNLYYESQSYASVPFGLAAIITMTAGAGWLFITGSTVGQRGVVACDLLSDDSFGYSYIISKVLQVPKGSVLRFFTTDEAAADFTGDLIYYVRSGSSASDSVFNSASGGWVQYDPYTDQSPAGIGPYFQIKVTYDILVDSKNIAPAQLHDVVVAYDEPGEIDYHWSWCNERTSQSGNTPMVVSIRQIVAHESAPTKFVLTGRDDEGNVVATVDTSVSPSQVGMSSNNGTAYTTWTNMSAFMTSFNSGAGTTELKFTISTPPAVPYITWSFKYV